MLLARKTMVLRRGRDDTDLRAGVHQEAAIGEKTISFAYDEEIAFRCLVGRVSDYWRPAGSFLWTGGATLPFQEHGIKQHLA